MVQEVKMARSWVVSRADTSHTSPGTPPCTAGAIEGGGAWVGGPRETAAARCRRRSLVPFGGVAAAQPGEGGGRRAEHATSRRPKPGRRRRAVTRRGPSALPIRAAGVRCGPRFRCPTAAIDGTNPFLPFVRSPATSIALIVLSPVTLIVVSFLPAYVIWRSTSVSTCGRLANGRGCTATAATSRDLLYRPRVSLRAHPWPVG